MKTKLALLICGICFAAILGIYQMNPAKADTKAQNNNATIGIVSVRTIFENCKKHAEYREEVSAEQDRIVAELEKLSKQIEADKAGLNTLKPGSAEYLELYKNLLEKQAHLEAKEQYHKKQLSLKDQRWYEELYKDIIKATAETAKDKGLKLVLEKNQPDLPAAGLNELMLTISTHKVLYSEGCLDITKEVMERIDLSK